MKRLTATLLGLLLALGLFSGCGNHYGPTDFPQFLRDPDIAEMMRENRETLVHAIKERDTHTIEAMMCRSIKQNNQDLPGKLAELIDTIEGEISDYEWSSSGGMDERKVRYGDVMQRRGYDLTFLTTTGEYVLSMSWVVRNSAKPEEEGIQGLSLRKGEVYLMWISAGD